MTTKIKTKLVKSVAWPGKGKQQHEYVNLDAVKKTKEPFVNERIILQHKYDEMFDKLEEGDCFQCPDEASMCALARAMRKHIERKGWEGVVRQRLLTEDRIPRVWCLKLNKSKNKS